MRYIRTRYVATERYRLDDGRLPSPLLPYVNAAWRSFLQQWQQLFLPSSLLSPVASALGPGIAVGYIAGQGGNPTALSYVFVGVALSVIWNMGVFRTGWSMAGEHSAGTLDLMMTTRTPLPLIMFGKALAIMAFTSVCGVVAFLAVAGVSGQLPSPEHAVLFLLAGCVALISVIATCFVFAPFSFLAGIRGGFFNALMPFGSVVSGFLYPVDLLPKSLEVVARLLPTSWAMQAVVNSVDGDASSLVIARDIAVALGLSALLLTLACLLFVEAERRMRVSGNLGSV